VRQRFAEREHRRSVEWVLMGFSADAVGAE
jgi:hypothetical protein